jgi:hypothetical protein
VRSKKDDTHRRAGGADSDLDPEDAGDVGYGSNHLDNRHRRVDTSLRLE